MQQDRSFAESMLAQQTASQTSVSVGGVSTPVSSTAQADLTLLETQRADLLSHYTADYPDVVAIELTKDTC